MSMHDDMNDDMNDDTDHDRERARLRRAAGQVQARLTDKLAQIWWAFLLRGVIAAALALALLFRPSASLDLLVVFVGLFCLADGVTGLVGAWRADERGAALAQAAFGLALGAILLFWPDASLRTLMILFGLWALVAGISHVLAARASKLPAEETRALGGLAGVAIALGLVLILWPGSGVVAIAWIIALAAAIVAALLIFVALRLRKLDLRLAELGKGHADGAP